MYIVYLTFKDAEIMVELFTRGIYLMEFKKTLEFIISLSLLLLFRTFPLLFTETLLAIKEQLVYW